MEYLKFWLGEILHHFGNMATLIVQGHSRSLTFVLIESPLINCGLSCITHRLWGSAAMSKKIAVFNHSPYFDMLLLEFFIVKLTVQTVTYWRTFQWKLLDPRFSCFVTIYACHWQTDRQHRMTVERERVYLPNVALQRSARTVLAV